MRINLQVLIIFFSTVFIYLGESQCIFNNDLGCDPRCKNNRCNVRGSSLDCCDGCKPYGTTTLIYYFLQLDVNPADTALVRTNLPYSTRCSQYCPAQQYPVTTVIAAGNIDYKCQWCARNCTLCTGPSNTECSTCASDNYKLSITQCYNDPLAADKTYGFNPCPHGYYGIQNTMTCVSCPVGCIKCSIYLQDLLPGTYKTDKNMANQACYVDHLCRYALKCFQCQVALGYFLEQGFCYKDQCRRYQLYNNTAGSFNPSYCYCMDGYYKSGLSCTLCHSSCKTCSGSTSSHCLTCSQGWIASDPPATCTRSTRTTKKQQWLTGNIAGSNGTFTIINTTPMPTPIYSTYTNSLNIAQTWLFGFSGYTMSASSMSIDFPSLKLQYSSSSLSDGGHYGIHFRGKFIFIDQWKSTESIIFRADNKDVYSYNYLMQQVKGQYLSGLNYHDHIAVIDFWFLHTNPTLTLTLSAKSNAYSWGIKDILIQQLGCHSSCTKCNGPTQFDCTQCPTSTNQELVNNDCVCIIATGYYQNNGACSLTCDSNQFKDDTTRKCVTQCTFPLMFHYNGKCYQKCPIDAPFRRWNDNYCVANCFDDTLNNDLNNLYKYEGNDKACYNVCPYGTYGDPQLKTCVSKCSSTSSKTDYANYGYFADGNFCVQTCSSGLFAFPGTRKCIPSCPVGFFENQIDYGDGKGVQKLCEEQCHVTLGGRYLYGDNTTKPYKCVDICPSGTFADQASRMCLKVCNTSSYKQLVNINGVDVGTCRVRCQSTTYNIFGNNQTQFCVPASQCPIGTYGDYLSTYCQIKCTDSDKYGNNVTRKCQTTCPTGWFKQRDLKICVKTCPYQNLANKQQFGFNQTGFCQQNCTGSTGDYYADIQQNRQCKKRCAESPMQTYGLNYLCVFNCSSSTWADEFNDWRICTTSCTNSASIKSYGYNETRKCVLTCPDTLFAQIIGGIPVCVYVCQNNKFGDPRTNQCVDHCTYPYYGDPTGNRTCNLQCAVDGYYALNLTAQNNDARLNRTCQLSCQFGWADFKTRMCAMSTFDCSQGLYGHQTNHECVLPIYCTGFADILTRRCLSNCSQTTTQKYFGVRQTHQCVLLCPNDPDYFGDNSTDQCESTCLATNQLRDPQNNRRCVLDNNCSRLPVALFGDTAKQLCVIALNCTPDTFGDNNTKKCQSDCQGPNSLLYADPVTKQCVDQCQLGYYALNTSTNVGVCSKRCPVPQYADNITVECTLQCTVNTYGVNITDPVTSQIYGKCETECPLNQFARDIDNLCLFNCGNDHWGQTVTRKCLTDPHHCPDGYYADNTTHMCVKSTDCSVVNGVQFVADNLTKQCLPLCPAHTIIINWADMNKKLCVKVCPQLKYGNNHTLKCQSQCKNADSTYNGQYADPQLRICVVVCSAAPIPTYGQNTTFTCVQARYCPNNQWADHHFYRRVCVDKCPDPRVNNTFTQMFADNITKKCVFQCPTHHYGNIIAQSDYAMCQSTCPPFANNTLKFAQNSTKLCVKVCSLGTFGDQVNLRCVKTCPIGWYAQRVHQTLPQRYCVDVCDDNTWSQEIKRTCVQDPFNCPTINGYHWYALNGTWQCIKTCPSDRNLWGQNTTYICQPSCVAGSYKYTVSRVCIDQCPGSLDDDGLFSDQGMCYSECITTNYYRDPQNDRSCQPQCSFSPIKYYKDSTTMKCVLRCPLYPIYYYAYDTNKQCRLDCPSTTMKDHVTQKCVSSCPINTFFDAQSDACVSKCPSDYSKSPPQIWYGDSTLSIPKCVSNTSCPSSYYADDNVQLCVLSCSMNQWKYLKNCVKYCPDGFYGNHNTGFCVQPLSCPTDYYGQNLTRLCVKECNGTFADTNKKICVDVCPINYYADSVTRLCSLTCTNTTQIVLYKNIDNRTCISQCPIGLFLNPANNKCQSTCADPLYEDQTTRICVTVCPSTPSLYGQNNTNKCVDECLNNTHQFKLEQQRVCVRQCPNSYVKNNITRFCVKQCFDNTYFDTEYCVFNCSPRYSLKDPNICTNNCPSPFYKDPTTFKCVLVCPTHPRQYYKVVTLTQRKCDLTCPDGQFRDDLTYSCVSKCPPSPATYADTTSGNCTTICSLGYYADKQSRTCKSKCNTNMYADPITRTCVYKCINGTNLYGDSKLATPQCVSLCTSGTFANPFTLRCQQTCMNYQNSYGFDNGTDRICLISCPYPYIADNSSYLCKLQCLTTDYPYLDKATKSCVNHCTSPMYQYGYLPTGNNIRGQCVKFCPGGYFAYLQNNTCVSVCPQGYYGQTTNNTCYSNCTLANNKYADKVTHLCVSTCIKYNNSYDSFADLYTRQCLITCPTDKLTIKDTHTRKCQPKCTRTDQYADWTTGYCVNMCPDTWYADPQTKSCVKNCSLYSQRYIYQTNRSCVSNCLDLGLFADDSIRKCVTALNCPDKYFGLISAGICIRTCPTTPDLFGDPVSKTCVSTCKNQSTGNQNYYADSSTRLCVKLCPPIPSLFARNDTRRCVSQCPANSYADNYTRRCIAVCSIIPGQTFADNSTNRCVSTCPTQPNFFSQNVTWKCVYQCPSNPKMYADYSTRKCVKYCPGGQINTYADEPSRFCVRLCPGNTFMQNSTRTCDSICKTGYADPKSRYCIGICPPYTYGHVTNTGIKTCKATCPTQNPMIYAQDGNNLCMTQCLIKYKTYRDPSSNRCVKICPLNESMFADNVSRICRTQCPQFYYADYSTRFCVSRCPQVPALFAILNTRVCTLKCPSQSWADNVTRKCLIDRCPSTPDTYGDNSTWTCVLKCPSLPVVAWSDDSKRQCVSRCPQSPDYYADNSTRRCVYNCTQGTYADSTSRMCVQTCPQGWYGVNGTRRCQRVCPSKQFADTLLNLCVSKCSVDPIYYGNPDNNICVEQCPSTNHSFGNPQTQQCVRYQLSGYSGCPQEYFADNITRLCVQVCPLSNDTYGDNSTWKCVAKCPAGLQNTFADNSTMRCVKTCPSYPQYYAQLYSRRCVGLCLAANLTYSGSFADNSTRKCVQKCPQIPNYFSDNSTRRCVLYCPRNPLTFADNQTRRCVSTCPSTPDLYGDLKTLICVDVCPQLQSTYADYSTRLCVKVCPTNPWLFADTQSNRCVQKCPNGTFADNSSRICVQVCPQYPQSYGDPSTNRCVAKCPQIPDLYADELTQECVLRCPQGYYAQNNTRKCLPICPYDKINYADKLTNKCVAKCPSAPLNFATYGDNRTKTCVKQCPLVPFTYGDNITRMCLVICNNEALGGYAQNNSRLCVTKCPDGSYGDITTRYCVRYCPNGWYADDRTNLCQKQCLSPYFADPTSWRCLSECPVSQLLFGQPINRTCTNICPQTTYADFDSQQCVYECPSKQKTQHKYDTFGFNDTNQCLDQCPVPLFGYPVTYVCVDICPDPYYQNITDHRCYKCPQQCQTCNYPQACLTCVQDHYLYAGICVQSCPTFPVITYANPKRQCGSSFQCTPGYFALNTTKTCVQNCPDGYFKNNIMQTCDLCQKGCQTCTNSTYCIICNTQLAIWFQFKCYSYCSPLRRFYTSTGCISQCPSGTYLNLTTCQSCSPICKTCVVQSQNCLLCSNGYYLQNNLCVEKCVENYKAVNQNGSLVCRSCKQINCTVTPLTYQINQYVQDFQYKFQLKFSEQVNINGILKDIIQIKKKTIRRLSQQQQINIIQEQQIQQISKISNQTQKNQKLVSGNSEHPRLLVTTYDSLDYTIIDYGGGIYQFILKNYNPSSNDNQFQMQILQPQSIQSNSGQLPSNTRSTILIDSANAYSIKDYIKAFTTYNQIIVIISFVLLILTFWGYYSIWSNMFDFMQIIFALSLVSIDLPPTPMYAFAILKYSFFDFLPNFFTLPQAFFNKKTMNYTYYSVMKDFIFLRNMGQIYFILVVLIIILAISYGISKKFLNKKIKNWCKRFIRETFWKKYVYNIINILFMPVFTIFFLNFRNYKTQYGIQGFSIFSSWLFSILILSVIVYFGYKLRKLSKQSPITYLMLQKAYNFITYQKIVLINNEDNHFINEKNEVDLKIGRQPRINQILILPFDLQTRITPLEVSAPLFNFLYKFLIAFFIAVIYDNATIQIFFCLLASIVYGIYLILKKPYFKVGSKLLINQIILHNLVVICLFLIVLLAFKIQMTSLSLDQKNTIGLIITLILIYGITSNIIYFIYRTYNLYFQQVWKPFVASDIFRENYTVEHLQLVKKYSQDQQLLKKNTRSRAQFLQAIKIQQGQALANMILRDPNYSGINQKFKNIKLRPDKAQIVKNDINNMFQTIHNEHERSNKSVRSSDRLSKLERQKVRGRIFQQIQQKDQQQYQHVKIHKIKQQKQQEQQVVLSLEQDNQSQYSFQYIQQEYPENMPIQQILKHCKTGNIQLP